MKAFIPQSTKNLDLGPRESSRDPTIANWSKFQVCIRLGYIIFIALSLCSATHIEKLPEKKMREMLASGQEVTYVQHLLKKSKSNVVREILRTPFYEFEHCPKGDVIDSETRSQYYFHSHRGGEHGHFHLFLRQKDGKPVHLIAISMDKKGRPVGLFTTNRWVTGEAWHPAEEVREMLPRFQIELVHPSWPTNRWVSSMVRLFYPQILELIELRDKKIEEWQKQYPDRDVFEDRSLEVLSEMPISVDSQVEFIQKVLGTYCSHSNCGNFGDKILSSDRCVEVETNLNKVGSTERNGQSSKDVEKNSKNLSRGSI